MEETVRQAFLSRPGMVDDAPGFLGMEVLVDHQDSSIFQLVTRWTDEASFRSWHSGPLHQLAHRWIPKGLRLDPAHTVVRTFDVLPGKGLEAPSPGAAAPIADVPRLIRRSGWLHWLRASFDGQIVAANPAFELLLQEASGALTGQSLWARLTEPDAASAQAILQSPDPGSRCPVLLNFVDREQNVQTLECHVEIGNQGFVLVGEPVRQDDQALQKEFLELNNRWALLVRENERNLKLLRRTKEDLERALADLNESHWHLRKIQETLPICMYCG